MTNEELPPPNFSDYQSEHSNSDQQFADIKTPPHSLEAEQSILGGVLLDNTTWDIISDRIVASDFYNQNNRIIFEAIVVLSSKSKPIDAVTLTETLELKQELNNVGGIPYIANLVNNTPTVANIVHYADIVRERSILRQLITVSREIGDSAFFPDGQSVPGILDLAESKIFDIANQGAKSRVGFKSARDMIPTVIDHMEKMSQQEGFLTGLPSGFDELDVKTTGLQDSDLVIVAGRPSMGKTTFAMNLVENVALLTKRPVAVFSMEMPAEQLLLRMMASLSRVSNNKIRTGKNISNEDWASLTSSAGMLSDAPIFIDDSPALSPAELRARVRRLKREQGDLAMIVIDYIQLMRSTSKSENRATEVSEISRNLKALAKEMEVPVIALSQLNRSLENRSDRRPVMSDLRESGAIEQDADVIMFLYRDEVYNKEASTEKGLAEVIIGKQRNGPIGTVRLQFFGEFTRFDNIASEYYQEMAAHEHG